MLTEEHASFVEIGEVAFEDTIVGEKITSSTNAEQMSTNDSEIRCVIVQAKNTNNAVIKIGNSSNQTFELSPGESLFIRINSLSSLYVKASNSGDGVNFIALM